MLSYSQTPSQASLLQSRYLVASARSYTKNMPEKSSTTKVKASSGRVVVVRRDSTTGKRVATISGSKSADAAKIAERLVEVLKTQDGTFESRLFFVTFPEALSRSFRATVIKRVEQEVIAAADEDDLPSVDDRRFPRQILPLRSGPSFTILFHSSGSEEHRQYCGFWLNPTTLVLGYLYEDSPLSGVCSVSANHWHPDSRTSGSWKDRYAVLGNGLDVEWSYKDEDGTYIKFHRAPSNSPAVVARRLVEGVASWYIFGAETRLLTAYFLGFSVGNVEWLGCDENLGYETDVSVRASEDVTRELKRLNPPPTQEEASLWLHVTKNAVHPSTWESWTAGEHPEEFLLTLRSIAEGTEYDDLTT
jgi:hypothetical protein